MSIFLSLEQQQNPFLLNAFKMADVSPHCVKPRDIRDLIEGRSGKIDYGDEIAIDAGGGKSYRVTIADLTSCEEVLCDPKRRPREELLVPEEHTPKNIDGVEEFITQYKLNPKTADQFLRLDPLDLTPVLVAGLPVIPTSQFSTGLGDQKFPSVAQINLTAAKLLVKKRHRRG